MKPPHLMLVRARGEQVSEAEARACLPLRGVLWVSCRQFPWPHRQRWSRRHVEEAIVRALECWRFADTLVLGRGRYLSLHIHLEAL